MKDSDQLCTSKNFSRTVRGLLLKTDFQPQSLHRQLPGVEIFLFAKPNFFQVGIQSPRLLPSLLPPLSAPCKRWQQWGNCKIPKFLFYILYFSRHPTQQPPTTGCKNRSGQNPFWGLRSKVLAKTVINFFRHSLQSSF